MSHFDSLVRSIRHYSYYLRYKHIFALFHRKVFGLFTFNLNKYSYFYLILNNFIYICVNIIEKIMKEKNIETKLWLILAAAAVVARIAYYLTY